MQKMNFYIKSCLNQETLIRYNAVMHSYTPAVVLHVFVLSLLLCVFLGCDNPPRVRLVKDDDSTFHFQWEDPLKEARIILIRYSGVTVSQYKGHYRKTPFDRDLLIYFPAGAFISAPARTDAIAKTSYEYIWGEVGDVANTEYIGSVDIFPAHFRASVLPAYVHRINAGGSFREREEHERILREYPLFKAYRLGEPTNLTFELPPALRDEPDSQGWRKIPALPPPRLVPPSLFNDERQNTNGK